MKIYKFKVKDYKKTLSGRFNKKTKQYEIIHGDGKVMAKYDENRCYDVELIYDSKPKIIAKSSSEDFFQIH